MPSTLRSDQRSLGDLRPIEIVPNFIRWAEGSVLCSFGHTRVLCTATLENKVPYWMKDQQTGWVTAEYAMLPRATEKRTMREAVTGKRAGRSHEISRLIGRAVRASLDMRKLGERTVTLDCDVIQADGGTRTAAITGAWVALRLATDQLLRSGAIKANPVERQVAAVSVGVLGRELFLDLSYEEDQRADTDLNLVMTDDGGIVEVQGTAEKVPFSRPELERMLELGSKGIEDLFAHQREALEKATL